jgi:aspartyl protease family protein
MTSGAGKERTFREFLIWLAVLIAGYLSFYYFETLYKAVQQQARAYGFERFFGPVNIASVHEPGLGADRGLEDLRGTIGRSRTTAQIKAGKRITLSSNVYGHFHVNADVGGRPVEFMTDTGATYVALTYETAVKLGIPPSSLKYTGRSTTANGVARVASIMLDAVRVGGITVRQVQAVVAEPGRMTQNLLGMSFIGRLSGFELSGNKLIMTE